MLLAAAGALALACVLTELVRRLALARGLTDAPAPHKAHRRPTPHLGGTAVLLATAVTGALASLLGGVRPDGATAALFLTGCAVGAVGLVDDLRPLGPVPRLVTETLAAAVLAAVAGLGPLAGAAAVVWIVLVTNAWNLLDHADGVMASVATATALATAACAALAGRPATALLTLVLAGALTGFLTRNWPPARIFLGDCGALFAGYVLAGAAVLAVSAEGGGRGLAVLPALFAVVLTDTALVVVSRLRAGRSPLRGGTDHTAHRLRLLRLTPRGTAVALATASAATATAALLVHAAVLPPWTLLALLLAAVRAVRLLLRVPVYRAPAPTGPLGRVAGPRTEARLPDAADRAPSLDG
ncbi:MraY family glycosyltransferase [Streptomyces sp. SCA2-2]|uniref:MraY family glycosyltransferase n=1 Tax=Streptomyces sp. SCA2-2 TaxID=1563677 RepID=UPI00101EBCAA|nr:MraY family glycosyltransferase [Streptomyces sp. SCA2-2]RZF04337.1 undecaprenyl-phosphate alpha-N-acetylglucosaminyl 1-phosphate transferase [Streptomyces sp. SCA2-2]